MFGLCYSYTISIETNAILTEKLVVILLDMAHATDRERFKGKKKPWGRKDIDENERERKKGTAIMAVGKGPEAIFSRGGNQTLALLLFPLL